MKDGVNGIHIELDGDGFGVKFQRIVNNELQEYAQYFEISEVYDPNQGNKVAGFIVYDMNGNPTGEEYRLNEFDMEGNYSQSQFGGTLIKWTDFL